LIVFPKPARNRTIRREQTCIAVMPDQRAAISHRELILGIGGQHPASEACGRRGETVSILFPFPIGSMVTLKRVAFCVA
jgi:hypothetical protein